MSERRRCARHRVLKPGTIEFNRAGGISCLVRNLSAAGACVEIESPFGIPETFILAISGERDLHHCKVAWKGGKRMGIAFVEAAAQPTAA